MEWWQHILVYLGVWVFGFFTGTQAGATMVISRLSPKGPQPPQPGNPQDMAAMMAMMGQGGPGRGQ